MKQAKYSEEQIVYAIRQADSGTPVCDLCQQLGVSDATIYAWKKKYAHLGGYGSEKKSTARPPPGTRPVVSRDVSGELRASLSPHPVQRGL